MPPQGYNVRSMAAQPEEKQPDSYFTVQNWLLRDLTANPDNYREHPPEQLEHIKHSLETLGQYKNVVATPEGVVLAGHGVVQAASELGWQTIAVHVFDGTPSEQRLLMIADNEISRMAEDDVEQLSQLLSAIDADGGLEGTGYDDEALASLLAEVDMKPLDWTPDNPDDQSGGGSVWNTVDGSDTMRLQWGDIEAVLTGELYERVKACLDAAFSAGGTYSAELERILAAGCSQCE